MHPWTHDEDGWGRRRYLRGLGTAAAAGLAGCVGGGGSGADSDTGRATVTDSPRPPLSERLPVPKSELTRGAGRDAIPAIVDPVFGDNWSGLRVEYYDARRDDTVAIEPRLADDDRVIGVEIDGTARAYPLRLLAWHEIANDTFPTDGGDVPLLVSYCPLCATGVVADRRVDGEPTVFGVSGLLFQSNLVMYDAATDSKWSQLHAMAIRGEKVGTRLDLRPSTGTTWREWRADHPDTEVLLPPPESSTVAGQEVTRNYTVDPYVGYDESERVGVAREEAVDGRLHPKATVLGVATGGAARAYPLSAVREAGGVVNDEVGGRPVVVAATPGESLVGFVRRVDGETLRFEKSGADRLRGGGSTWDLTSGTALDGPYDGTELDPATDRPAMYWFSWADAHPDTDIYGGARSETDDGR